MDIVKLQYLIQIVENNYNVTLAAEKAMISQPAMSKMLIKLEWQENIEIFERNNGRLVGLTPIGERIYETAKEVVKVFNELENIIYLNNKTHKGEVYLGIPQIVMSALCTDLLNSINTKYPLLKLNILEEGTNRLVELLMDNTINIAIVNSTNKLSVDQFNQIELYSEPYFLYINTNHPLAKQQSVEWNDLNGLSMVTVNKDFGTYDLLMDKLKEEQILLKDLTTTAATDYIISHLKKTDYFSILPECIGEIYSMENLKKYPLKNPIMWDINLVSRKNSMLSGNSSTIVSEIKNYFANR